MNRYIVTRMEGLITLRLTPMAAIDRVGQFFLRSLFGLVTFIATLDINTDIPFLDLIEAGSVEFDRTDNELRVDGRRVCRLDKVTLDVADTPPRWWINAKDRTRTLGIRYVSRHYHGIPQWQATSLGKFPVAVAAEIATLVMFPDVNWEPSKESVTVRRDVPIRQVIVKK